MNLGHLLRDDLITNRRFQTVLERMAKQMIEKDKAFMRALAKLGPNCRLKIKKIV